MFRQKYRKKWGCILWSDRTPMPSYAYRAVDQTSGRVASGRMGAASEPELAHYLSAAGMELIQAREEHPLTFGLAKRRRSLPPRLLAAFCSRMHDLLQAGLSFPDSLTSVMEATPSALLRDALRQIGQAIAHGGGISESFALYPRLFPPLVTALLAAGETSGDMESVFGFLARYAGTRAETQEKMRRALRYPIFLVFIAGGASVFMLATVVPQVALFLTSLQGHLPLSTRLLIGLSNLVTQSGLDLFIFLLLLLGGLFIGRWLFPSFARASDAVVLKLPFVGMVITKASLARFAQSFLLLFRSGCAVPDCMDKAAATVTNKALRLGLQHAEERVLSGASLSIALSGVLPPFAMGVLRVGEKSGALDKALADIAQTCEREAQAASDTFIGVLEPALTLAIGGLLAWTVAAMLGPLYGGLAILGGQM